MSHNQSLPDASFRRRRRLGDSVPGCLLTIALVLGGSIWGYFKFFHYSKLNTAGSNHKTFVAADNRPAYLEYGRRFRNNFSVSGKAMLQQNHKLIKDFKAGKYKGRESVFEEETKTFINALNTNIADFDGQLVPTNLEKPHINLSKAHGLCYQSVQHLRDAMKEEGPERDRLVKESERLLKEAWKLGTSAIREHTVIWGRDGT